MDSTLRINDLFNVDGLVAVITGGGTGSRSSPFYTYQQRSADGRQVP